MARLGGSETFLNYNVSISYWTFPSFPDTFGPTALPLAEFRSSNIDKSTPINPYFSQYFNKKISENNKHEFVTLLLFTRASQEAAMFVSAVCHITGTVRIWQQ